MADQGNGDQAQFDAAKVLRQVEYYFGDANMRRDKWLVNATKENNGYVKLADVCAFNKMKALKATDVGQVAAVLAGSEVVELNDDGTLVKRRHPMPEFDDSEERTVYAKGFPTDTTLEQLQEFWGQHGKVNMVNMRRAKDGFKGSLFVEFSTQEEAKAVVEKKGDIKFGDNELEIATKKEWANEKREARQAGKGEKGEKGEGKGDRKRKREDDDDTSREEYVKSLEERSIPENQVLRAEGLPENATLFSIQEFFNEIQEVRFVEFTDGETHCNVRFQSDCSNVPEALKDRKFGESTVTATVLTPDEAKAYWIRVWTEQHDRRVANRAQGGRGGRGGRGGGRGRGGRGGRGRGGGRGGRGGRD